MTDKKEKILNTALELFANEGFNAVPTSLIAKQAGVSEGLIFRHFTNKKGLLDAIVESAERKLNEAFAHVLFESDPKAVVRKVIELPFDFNTDEYAFWKLQFKLKWEAGYNNPQKMKPVLDKMTWAFEKLGYQQPEQEAFLLNQIIESVSVGILRDGTEPEHSYKSFLLEKYGV